MRSVHQMGCVFGMRSGAKFDVGTLEFRNPVSVKSVGPNSDSVGRLPRISFKRFADLGFLSAPGYMRTWLVGANKRARFMYAFGD
jgi:hypothetical protein